MARTPGVPVDQISILKPGGNLSLFRGMSAAGVTVSLPGKGASVELAMSAGMPCFQAGGGAAGAAGAAVWAMDCPMPKDKTAAQMAIFLNIKKLLLVSE